MYRRQYKGLSDLAEKSLFVSGLDPPCCSGGFPLTVTSRGSPGGLSRDPAPVEKTV